MLAVVALFAACGHDAKLVEPGTPRAVEIDTSSGTVHVTAEIADTESERQKGLMGRTTLAEDRGMAFLWTEPVSSSFWMKDTLIPLSIAFWGQDGRIVDLEDMQPCRQDPCPTYGPDEPFVGALEVNLGFFADHGVAVGDRVVVPGEV